MIRRAAAAAVLGLVAWLAATALSAGAQTPAQTSAPPTAGSRVVNVVLGNDADPIAEQGVLARTDKATPAPLIAVLVGLSVLGATLAVITVHRRTTHVRLTERTTGVVAGRRARTDFWHLPAPARARRPVSGPLTRSVAARQARQAPDLRSPRSGSHVRRPLPTTVRRDVSRPPLPARAAGPTVAAPDETAAPARAQSATRA